MTVEGADKAANDVKKVGDAAKGTEQAIEGSNDAAKDLTGSLDNMTGGAIAGLQGMVSGVKKGVMAMKTLRGAVMATGIGALVVIIGSLITAFKSSEEGAETFNRIMGVLGSVVDNLMDVVASFGEFLIKAFSDPKQAIIDLATTIKDNLLNRLVGIVEFIPSVASAIKQVFEGDFAGAAETATNAVAKVSLGVEDFTQKTRDAIQAGKDFADQLVEEGKIADEIAQMRNKATRLERELLVERSELESQIAEKRLISRQEEEYTAEQRKQALLDAQALEEQLLAKETEVLELRRDATIEENKLARSTQEALDAEAEATAAVNRQRAARLNAQRATQRELLRVNKQIEAERKAARKEQEAADKAAADAAQKLLDARTKLADDLYKATLTGFDKEEQALMEAYEAQVAIAGDDEGLLLQAEEVYLMKRDELVKKYADKEQADKDKRDAEEAAKKQLLVEALASEQELELMKLQAEYDAKLELARRFGEGEEQLEKELADKKGAINDKYRKAEADANKKALDEERAAKTEALLATLDFASQALSILNEFNSSANDEDERTARQRFERGKKIQKAGVIASTASAVIAALAAPPVGLGFPAGLPGAALAAASGALQIRKINQMQFESGGGGDDVEAPSRSAATAITPQSNQLTLGTQGAFGQQSFAPSATTPTSTPQSGQQPVRAYVVSTEVTSAQQLDSQLANQATL